MTLSPDEWEVLLVTLITLVAALAITVTVGWINDMLDYRDEGDGDGRSNR